MTILWYIQLYIKNINLKRQLETDFDFYIFYNLKIYGWLKAKKRRKWKMMMIILIDERKIQNWYTSMKKSVAEHILEKLKIIVAILIFSLNYRNFEKFSQISFFNLQNSWFNLQFLTVYQVGPIKICNFYSI